MVRGSRSVWILQQIVLFGLLGSGAVLTLAPFMLMVSAALSGPVYTLDVSTLLIPAHPTVSNFVDAWQSSRFALHFLNSLLVALSTTLLCVLLSSMLAYAFARFEFRGKSIMFNLLLFTLMVPSLLLVIPEFFLIKQLGLRNSLEGLIIVYTAMGIPLNTFLLRGFFEGLPRALDEAVLADGGGYLTIFLQIILPLSTPALATVTIFTFLFSWDEFTWALTAIDDAAKRTLPVAIATFQSAHGTQWGLVFAASLIAVAPVILTFLTLQRYFVQGLTTAAVKG